MASLGHVAIGMAAGRAYGGRGGSRELAFRMVALSAASLLPARDEGR